MVVLAIPGECRSDKNAYDFFGTIHTALRISCLREKPVRFDVYHFRCLSLF